MDLSKLRRALRYLSVVSLSVTGFLALVRPIALNAVSLLIVGVLLLVSSRI